MEKPSTWEEKEKKIKLLKDKKDLEEKKGDYLILKEAKEEIETLFELKKEGENVDLEIEKFCNFWEEKQKEYFLKLTFKEEIEKHNAYISIHPGIFFWSPVLLKYGLAFKRGFWFHKFICFVSCLFAFSASNAKCCIHKTGLSDLLQKGIFLQQSLLLCLRNKPEMKLKAFFYQFSFSPPF